MLFRPWKCRFRLLPSAQGELRYSSSSSCSSFWNNAYRRWLTLSRQFFRRAIYSCVRVWCKMEGNQARKVQFGQSEYKIHRLSQSLATKNRFVTFLKQSWIVSRCFLCKEKKKKIRYFVVICIVHGKWESQRLKSILAPSRALKNSEYANYSE